MAAESQPSQSPALLVKPGVVVNVVGTQLRDEEWFVHVGVVRNIGDLDELQAVLERALAHVHEERSKRAGAAGQCGVCGTEAPLNRDRVCAECVDCLEAP